MYSGSIIKGAAFSAMLFISFPASSQVLHSLKIADKTGLAASGVLLTDSSSLPLQKMKPLFTFEFDKGSHSSAEVPCSKSGSEYLQVFDSKLRVTTKVNETTSTGIKGELLFENQGRDTVTVSNVVPFGEDNASVYITGKGTWKLARAWLFRPGYGPVRVILPDDAWEMGYSSFTAGRNLSLCSIARRTMVEGGQKQRYATVLPPGAKVTYTLYTEVFKGEWQNGLRIMFRDRYLHDLDKFDNSLYERDDLKWIKQSYLIILQMAWDREFYDRLNGKYTYPELIKKGIEQFGNIDVCGIWPTWPRLGLDQRNQWDLYGDLPGGTSQLRSFVIMSHQAGTRVFVAYNPWDNSTRQEGHYKGMAGLISKTEADGVVLDTKGSSSFELQAAADSVKKGVIMYSEGMAIPKDMPGIIAGRVHNAIFLSPELNLNKLIKPDFAIFRVCDVGEDVLHREIAIAFFNGYGTELNMFRPGGRDGDFNNDLNYLARTTFILRQNNDAFLDQDWTPLIETNTDGVFVNKWESGKKTIYSVLSMRPQGINGNLIKAGGEPGIHYVSLWDHENINPITEKGITCLPVNINGWDPAITGTRKEGAVDCLAGFQIILGTGLKGDSLYIKSTGNDRVIVWKGNPSYQAVHKEFRVVNDTTVRVKDLFGYYEGKIVVQLIKNKLLKDENILELKGGVPWLISKVVPTRRSSAIPANMVLVPGGYFSYTVTANDNFIPYPDVCSKSMAIDSFLIDKYPVTNSQYYDFLVSSNYNTSDTTNYLKHWQSGMYKQGQDKYPVVYLSIEDMKAYARWAGKRLPTEAEWQLAAQGKDKRIWPWGDEFHGTNCNNSFNRPTPVDAFPKGQSPYGAVDMVGNIWQMTNDMYFNGTNYFTIIRGGSYYKPESSWWYIQGGPQSLDKTQMQLLVSPGFDRSSTVGFRCVMDIDSKSFRGKQ